jgi:ribonuclease P protein component
VDLVLTREHRLRSGRGFAGAIRAGNRAGSRTLVLHLGVGPGPSPSVGFVVSKAVGNAVMRNQVKRRLRHIARERLSSLPGSAVLVVRALPAAAHADYATLTRDFESALGRVLARRTAAGSA